jgi:hypothetical protein
MTEATSEPTEKKSVTKKKMPTWQKVLIGVVAFFVIVFGVAIMATDAPAQVSDKFVNNILGNNSELAYDMLTDDTKTTITDSEFADVVSRMSSVLAETATQQERSVDTQNGVTTATVTYSIVGSDGTYTMVVNLLQDNGVWKVQNFDNSVNKE